MAPIPDNEGQRLEALRAYRILDTHEEKSYDDLTHLASYICDAPIAMISFVDEKRQWFKSKIGVGVKETARDVAFCAHAINQSDVFVVNDAEQDVRFADNPLVTGDPHVRFYAGAPLTNSEGYSLGTLCVIDRVPRTLTEKQSLALKALSRQAVLLMEMRRVSQSLADAVENVKTLHGMLPICCYCKRIRDDNGYWNQVDEYLRAHTDVKLTHGACTECAQKAIEDFRQQIKDNPGLFQHP